MTVDFKTEMSQRVLEDINNREENAHQKMLEKMARYEAAKKGLNIFQDKLWRIKYKLNNTNDSNKTHIQNQYRETLTQYTNADIDVSVFRDSLNNSISYYSKMSNSAAFANAMLA